MAKPVIFDFLSDPMGGLLTSARAFLRRVRQFDPDTRIIVLEMNGAISSSLDNADQFEWVNIQKPVGWSGWSRMIWQNITLPSVIRKYEASVYISLSHYLPWTIPAYVKTIVGVSNLAPFSQDAYRAEIKLSKKLRLLMLRRSIISAAKRADRVIALSDTCLGELVCRGVPLGKIVVIPNGVDLPGEMAEIETQGFSLDKEFILCVSHFYRYKNYERLVRGYALLPESLRQRYRLMLVGKPYDAAYFESIKNLVSHLKLSERVVLIPGLYGSELSKHYRNCALFMFPTLIENSPITLLEAMAHGAPVAAADISAMREFGGVAIEYFDPHSEMAMAKVMEAMLVTTKAGDRLRKLGPKQALQYTWDGFTEKLVQLYLKVSG